MRRLADIVLGRRPQINTAGLSMARYGRDFNRLVIKAEGVDKGSARYELLIEDMNKRIKRLCELHATSQEIAAS